MPVSTHTAIMATGAESSRATRLGTRKIPEPIMVPATMATESRRPSLRGSSVGVWILRFYRSVREVTASGGAGRQNETGPMLPLELLIKGAIAGLVLNLIQAFLSFSGATVLVPI